VGAHSGGIVADNHLRQRVARPGRLQHRHQRMAQAVEGDFVDLPPALAPLAAGRVVFRAGQHESGGE